MIVSLEISIREFVILVLHSASSRAQISSSAWATPVQRMHCQGEHVLILPSIFTIICCDQPVIGALGIV